MSEVISSFKSLRAGSQVFALLMLLFLCDCAYYVVGSEPAVAMYLALWLYSVFDTVVIPGDDVWYSGWCVCV